MKVKFKTVIIITLASIISALSLFGTAHLIKVNKICTFAQKTAIRYGVNASIVCAVIYAESNFNEKATSKKGAKGVMQIMAETEKFVSEIYNLTIGDLYSYEYNVTVGVCYLHYLYKKFNYNVAVLSAYNAGEGKVKSWLKTGVLTENAIPYKETRAYVKKVLKVSSFFKFL